MKSTVIFLGIFVAYVQCTFARTETPIVKTFQQSLQQCVESMKPSEETVKLITDEKVNDNKDVNCMRACILRKADLLKDAKLNIDNLENLLKSDKYQDQTAVQKALAAVKDCKEKAEVSDDECVVVENYMKCLKPFIDDVNGRATSTGG